MCRGFNPIVLHGGMNITAFVIVEILVALIYWNDDQVSVDRFVSYANIPLKQSFWVQIFCFYKNVFEIACFLNLFKLIKKKCRKSQVLHRYISIRAKAMTIDAHKASQVVQQTSIKEEIRSLFQRRNITQPYIKVLHLMTSALTKLWYKPTLSFYTK